MSSLCAAAQLAAVCRSAARSRRQGKWRAEILNNYSACLSTREVDPRRKVAIGLSQLADLYSRLGGEAMGGYPQSTEQLCIEKDNELQSLLSAAFVR